MIAGERFVIQHKQKDGTFVDWINPMGKQRVDYATYEQARMILRRRCNPIDYRIVRRVWTYSDFPV